MEKPTYTAIDYNSKENKVIEERIRNYYLPVKNTFEAVLYGRLNIPDSPRGLCSDLRCSEGNMVGYRLWINPEDMMRIEPLLEGGDRIWMEELEMYYIFFYEIRNGRRVLGKDRIKEILDILL